MEKETPANEQGGKPDVLSRLQVRQVRCPECQAEVGDKCTGRRGERERNHMSRVRVAKATLEGRA